MPNSLKVFLFAWWLLNWGGLYADFQYKHHNQQFADEMRRSDAAFSMFVAVVLPLTPFVTGFYQNGWLMPFTKRTFALPS